MLGGKWPRTERTSLLAVGGALLLATLLLQGLYNEELAALGDRDRFYVSERRFWVRQVHGLEIGGFLQEDGLEVFSGFHETGRTGIYYNGPELRSPYVIRVDVASADAEFKIYLSRTAAGHALFSHSVAYPELNGVFLQDGTGRDKVVRRGRPPAAGPGPVGPIELACADGQLRITRGSSRLTARVPCDPLRLSLITNQPSPKTLVRAFTLSRGRPGGAEQRVAGGAFRLAPRLGDLPARLGLPPRSRAAGLMAVLVTAISLLALNALLALIAPRRLRRCFSLPGLLLCLFPLSQAGATFLASALALAPISPWLCSGALLLALGLCVLRHGPAPRRDGPGELSPPARLLRVLPGALLLLLVVRFLLGDWGAEYYLPDPAEQGRALWLVLIPLLALASLALLIREHSAAHLTCALLVFCNIFWIERLTFTYTRPLFLAIGLLGWTLCEAAALARCRRRGPWLALPLVLLCASGALCVEVMLRSNQYLYRTLCVDFVLQITSWQVAEHTDLLRDPAAPRTARTVHGRRLPVRKAPGTLRVVCLGSSSTYGMGASLTSTHSYPARLEATLNAAGGPRVEVINGGVVGAPYYYLHVFFEQVLADLSPDVVILYFGDNGARPSTRRIYERIAAEVRASPFLRTEQDLFLALQLRYNPPWVLAVYRHLVRSFTFNALTLLLSPGGGAAAASPAAEPRDEALLGQEVAQTLRLCARRRIPVLLVPELVKADLLGREQPGRAPSYWYATFQALAARHAQDGVRYASLLDRFTREDVLRYFVDDVHLNDEGYAALARAIGERLQALGLLGARAGAPAPPGQR